MIENSFLLAVRNLIRRKLRSWLTMIGIFIGIAALVSLISLGNGLQAGVTEQFTKLGTDKIIISPGGLTSGPPGSSLNKLTKNELNLVEKSSGVKETSPVTFRTLTFEFNKRKQSLATEGISLEDKQKKLFIEMASLEIDQGRELKKGDSKKIMIGYELAHNDKLFSKLIKLGDSVALQGNVFKVVGILKKTGNPMHDRVSYISLKDDEDVSGQKEQYDYIYVRSASDVKPSDVAENIKKDIRRSRNEKAGEEDFGVETLESIGNTFSSILSIVQAVILGIASISVIVGGVGIMNTMYTSVTERTREIGVLKAIGARDTDIMSIFLIESGLLGLVGGLIGVLIGMGLSKLVEIVATAAMGSPLIKAQFPLYLILGALFFSFLIGTISGALPAYQASRMKPVDALRYE